MKKEERRRRQTGIDKLSSPKAEPLGLANKVCITTAPSLCAHTPRYLALGTSSTGLDAVCGGSTLGVLHQPP